VNLIENETIVIFSRS